MASGKLASHDSMTSHLQYESLVACLKEVLLLAQVASESKMAVDVEEYVSSFRTDLCDVLAAWSRGSKFGDIMKMTDVFEVH